MINIPIYKTSKEKYYSDLEKQKEEHHTILKVKNKDIVEKTDPILEKIAESGINRYQWEYNEIIGYIKIHGWSKQIRGDFYIKPGKIHKNSKGKIKYSGKLFSINTHRKTNTEIFEQLLETIIATKQLKRRHLDLELLKYIGNQINWIEFSEQIK